MKKNVKSNLKFEYVETIKEVNSRKLFGVSFFKYSSNVFCVVGGKEINVYEIEDSEKFTTRIIYSFADYNDIFYTCDWTYDDSKKVPVILVAGSLGIIRVIKLLDKHYHKVLLGHGSSVNELMTHCHNPNLVFSASKDRCVKLWHWKMNSQIAIFGGIQGHRDECLSLDINYDASLLVTCGLDHCIMLYSLQDQNLIDNIDKCEMLIKKGKCINQKSKIYPIVYHFPVNSTRKIHTNYVDCVKFFGKFILSKSIENKIVVWQFSDRVDSLLEKLEIRHDEIFTENVFVIKEFLYDNNEIWFIKFDISPNRKMLCTGNHLGKVFIWDLLSDNLKCHSLDTGVTVPVRKVTFDRNSNTIVAVNDLSSIYIWRLVQ